MLTVMNVIFLDRDGTLVVEPSDERVDSIDKVELFADTIESLKYLAENNFAAVIITNQAGIAEGRMTEDDFWTIHCEILRRLEPSGIKILKTYMNNEKSGPHASEWRKPGPKMLLRAAEDLNLDITKIFMIGDNESDIAAAMNAGLKGGVLVQTATNRRVTSDKAAFTAAHLLDAVHFVVDQKS